MTRLVLLMLLVLATAGFGSCGVRKDAPPPVVAQCDAMCYLPCVDEHGDTGVRWEGEPDKADTLDALGGEVVPQLAEKLRTCETRRKACALCLDRLQHEGVIQ
jgi:hypothetical protein